jgi:2-aminobenzoate-CoA ligase
MTPHRNRDPRSAHVDTFARDHLPPRELWPVMESYGMELHYPDRLNCAVELVDRHVKAGHGDRIAIRAPGVTWTYRDLMDRSNRIARVLLEQLGVVPGNRILIRGPNTPMYAAIWLGVLKAGATCVSTMPLLRTREIAYILDKARISLALCDTRVAAECEQAAQLGEGRRVVHFMSDAPDALEAMMVRESADYTPVLTAANDISMIAFTSGTTGQAKGTMHTHSDVLAVCDTFSAEVLRPSPDDLFCGSPPLAFTFGLGGLLLFPLRAGASTLLLEQATPPFLLKGMQDFHTTVCFTAPTAYRAMAALAKDFDLSALKKCVSAGEHLPAATFHMWEKATGVKIIDGIGSTEMLHIFVSAAGDEIRPGATGKAIPGYQARVVDDDGRELPPGQVGHLAVRGPTGCRYIDNEERQRAYVQHGWNLPGDSYRMDEDGYFWYQARTDDLIVSSGYKISGPEVENALLEHRCVMECGVVAVPDEERGSLVKAFIVLREGYDGTPELIKELQDFVKAQIAPYKYPRSIEFVSALPKTETGKLQRYRLRQTAHGRDSATPRAST